MDGTGVIANGVYSNWTDVQCRSGGSDLLDDPRTVRHGRALRLPRLKLTKFERDVRWFS